MEEMPYHRRIFFEAVEVVLVGKEKKDRVDDALCATRAAIEEGIVPGVV